jgi:hypothetical protein
MSLPSEYHVFVRRSILASFSVLTLLALLAIFVSTGPAQISTAPSSAASAGAVGHSATGAVVPFTGSVRPPTGTVPNVNSLGNPRIPFAAIDRPHFAHHRHHHSYSADYPPLLYAFPVPYAVDNSAIDSDADADEDDPNYQGGPTIFDRRGSGADSYVPPVGDIAPGPAQSADASPAPPEPPQPPTLLVFKDGHTIEVGNYAIVGATLFDLTPGHTRKVALADLDLEATSKQNDERGVTFQLPSSQQAD